MTGTIRTIGYNRSSNGPDLAQVGANEQLVSHVQNPSPASDLIAYAVKGYVGNWFSQATIRYGVWAAASASAAPGALLARTVQVNPSVNYVDGAGGQERTLDLESPILVRSTEFVALGIGSATNAAGVAMYQASAISQPNENFYRRGISGNNLTTSGGDVSNQGQLALALFGEYNVAPTAPTDLSPSGTITTRTPNIYADFNDPNKTLNNGVAWDYAAETQIQVRDGTTVIWDYTYTTTSTERSSHRTVRRYAGPALGFYKANSYRVRHKDRAGEWGAWSSYVNFTVQHTNRAPNKPSNVAPVGNINGNRAITLAATFTDPDYPTLADGQQWEWFDAKRVTIRRVSDNAIAYSSGIVSVAGSQRTNRRSSTAVTLPAWDTDYRVYEEHRDRSGAWSPAATWIVRAVSGGSVDEPTTPAGRVTNLVNPGNITFVYNSTGGLNGNLVRVGIFWPNGSGPRSQRDVVTTTTPGVPKVVSWSSLWNDISVPGFPFQEPGTDWLYAVKVRDTAGNWTDWSPFQELNLNAAPTTPTLYGPQNGRAYSYVPSTSVRARDPDQPNSELTTTAEIYDAVTDALIDTYTLPWLSGHSQANVWGVAPAAITGYGDYKWRARTFDGYLHGAWSPMWSFTYAAVPTVTVASPAGPTITTSQPQFQWTSVDQTHWRVQAHDDDQNMVYDTGEQVGGDQAHLIGTSQYWIGGERWNNGETFTWTVSVRDSSTLWGTSEPLTLTLEYIAPEPLIVHGDALSFPGVKGTHYAALAHNQTDYTEEAFRAYVWDRVEIDGPAGNEIPGTVIENFARITNSADTVLTDFDMTSNQWYRWGVRQEIQQGVDIITSDPVYVELMVNWHGTILHMPFDPLSNFVWLNYGANEYRPRRERIALAAGSAQPSGYRAPIGYTGSARQTNPSGEYTFIANDTMSHIAQLDALDRMFEYQFADASPDGRPHIMCWREGRGGRKGRLYVFLANWEDSPSAGRTTQAVTLQFEERHYRLGVEEEAAS